MKNKLTKKDYEVLYHLINYHNNTIGEIGVCYLKCKGGEKGDYLWEMELIEKKLADIVYPIKKVKVEKSN